MNVDGYRRGIQLFNQRHFFDAHEIWEDVWRESSGAEKKFLQGLIQAAVAFHHYSTGNLRGACSLMERARKNLVEYPGEFAGIRVAFLCASLAGWRESLTSGKAVPAFPELNEVE